MKIFSFDPETGRKGPQVGTADRISWAGQSVPYQVTNGLIAPIPYRLPDLGGKTDIQVHVDAGRTDDRGKDVSYLHPTEWRMMCVGLIFPDDVWWWVILPPASAIKPLSPAPEGVQ